MKKWTRLTLAALLLGPTIGARGQDAKPVSYYRDLVPLFKRSCTGCHHPGKLKGDLDLTTYTAFSKGGKHGSSFVPGDPAKSLVIEEITGDEPSMPKEGDPLAKAEVTLIERWIRDGGLDDTPAEANSHKLSEPPVYAAPPLISALAFSPDGKLLAVSGYHEVLLHHADGSGLIARLVGESPRIESIAFSPNGELLAVSGGAPARFGEIQIWDASTHKQLKAFKITLDSLYGVSFAPDNQHVAFGCADKTVRLIALIDGKELVRFDNHSDWVFGTLFTVDGRRLLTGSRDRAMKLIDVKNGQFIDDINKLLEPVLCIARHPKEDIVVCGGELGTPRAYKISDNQGRTAANNDVNLIREYERQSGPVRAIAYSPDAKLIAVAGTTGEVRLYKTADGSKAATLEGHEGSVFAVIFHPENGKVVTGGFDGQVRIFDASNGKLMSSFVPVPLKAGARVATNEASK